MLKNKEYRKMKREYRKVVGRIMYFIKQNHGTFFTTKKCTDLKNILTDANDKLARVNKEIMDYCNSLGLYPVTDEYSKETFELDRKVIIKKMGIDDQLRIIRGLRNQP